MTRPRRRHKKSPGCDTTEAVNQSSVEPELHNSTDSYRWQIKPVYLDGCAVVIDERGMVIISQARLMEREAQVELSVRELAELMVLLPDVLRAAHAHGKESS